MKGQKGKGKKHQAMKILIANNTIIPVHAYGGTERIIWWLGKELGKMGHDVTYLVKKGSECPFAKIIEIDDKKTFAAQIPPDTDLAHFHFEIDETLPVPHITTVHGNSSSAKTFHRNTVFISHNHAKRHGADVFVYNGIDFDDYGKPMTHNKRLYFHFLGNAAWRVKNVRGAIDVADKAGVRLHVIGGSRVNFSMGLRITLSPQVRFHGMLGGDGKNAILQASKGLIFPVLWHEPFGLAIIESLYFGCPVFGTPYGSLPELLGSKPYLYPDRKWNGRVDAFQSEVGFLSGKKMELVEAVKEADQYDRQRCQDYAVENFSSRRMAEDYLKLYEKILNGETLHAESPVFEPMEEEARYLPLK